METKKWGLWVLTAFVIGNMVGGGVFMLPANLAQVSGPRVLHWHGVLQALAYL